MPKNRHCTCTASVDGVCDAKHYCNYYGPAGGGSGDPGGLTTSDDSDGQTPIIVKLDGGPFKLTGLDNPVSFDLNGDGVPDTFPGPIPPSKADFWLWIEMATA